MRDLDSWLLFCRLQEMKHSDKPQPIHDEEYCVCARLLARDDEQSA